jgi:hypothetical protein
MVQRNIDSSGLAPIDPDLAMGAHAHHPGPVRASPHRGEPSADARHPESLSVLAAELGIPLDEVRRVYGQHLSRLKSDASVGQYLVLLATRRTRDELLGRDGGAVSRRSAAD